MSRLALIVAVVALSGCASMGEWRTASINSSSESAFRDSVTRLDNELPNTRRQMFRLALVDIARTGAQEAGETTENGAQAYTDEDFRGDLDGLTYNGVIALADRTGTPIATQYQAVNAQRWAEARNEASRQFGPWEPAYQPTTNPGLILSDSWKPNNGR